MVGQIYPTELSLNKANTSDTEAPFLDLNLTITNGIVSSKSYDKRDDFNLIELVALLNLSSWCLVLVVWLFLAVPWVCLRFVIVVFPDHTHLLLYRENMKKIFLHETKTHRVLVIGM